MNIIATLRFLDEFSLYEDVFERYRKNGISTIRVNFGRGGIEEKRKDLRFLKQQGKLDRLNLLFDLPCPGKKFRIEAKETNSRNIRCGESVCFSQKEAADFHIHLPWEKIQVGERIYIGDGELSFIVTHKMENGITAEAERDGCIRGNRAVVFEKGTVERNTDLSDYLGVLKEFTPNKIALSFVETADDILEVRKQIKAELSIVPEIYAKIESQAGVDNLSEILDATDRVMLGRGDLALNADVLRLAENQEKVLSMCKEKNVACCIATDILISLYSTPIPTRGDLIDAHVIKNSGCEEIVCSAGIAGSELLDRFCYIMKNIK